ncbi:hypothetical protein X802_08485 [Thermococcus guaymasensis DSM 11113]|uniref:Uncharacterized protein n=1 Tax=Thermococcus guaymasensis DSM 11113 TaxID=1432656 RepID=A0A0X1KND3_9EURY|nr:hypothetical protein X802_08485 [Thermococcus guaymasensis DSM 11113]
MRLDKDTIIQGFILFLLWMAFQIEFKKFLERVR